MLVIAFKNGTEQTWHVGEQTPYERWCEINDDLHEQAQNRFEAEWLESVSVVQADGHELEHIQNLFFSHSYSIPMPHGKRVVRWTGDTARNILLNL